jgi:hypothetical protein
MVSGSEWEEQQRIKLTQSAVHLASVSSPFYSGAAERRVRAKEETAGGAAAAAAAAAGGRTDSLTCAELSPGYAPHPAATSAARRTKARRKGQAEAGWPYGVELVCLTESHPNLLEASNLSGRLSRRIHHVHAISTTNPGFILPHHHHVYGVGPVPEG